MKLIPWILIVLLSIMLMLSWCSRPADNSGKLAPDTLWTLVVDTIRDTIIPPPDVEHHVRVDTVLLPVSMEDPDVDIDSTLPDSMPVIIPIMEREYRTDDYRILINGYNPELKSVELYRPTMLGTIKQRINGGGLVFLPDMVSEVAAFLLCWLLLSITICCSGNKNPRLAVLLLFY